MEQYLEKLLEQIRCKKVHPYIRDEIENHIRQQTEDNIASGMKPDEAERKAVEDMGDPVTAGIRLDAVHRPRVAWGLSAIVSVLSILGIILQMAISSRVARSDTDYIELRYDWRYFLFMVLAGLTVMGIIYFIDYTVIARYSIWIGAGMMVICLLGNLGVFGQINGMHYYIGRGFLRFSASAFMMFYVPVYGAILYRFRGSGAGALSKAVIWMLLPVVLTGRIPSLTGALTMLVTMCIQLTFAVSKGWYKVSPKKVIPVIWGLLLLLPAAFLSAGMGFHLLAEYQQERLRTFLTGAGDGFYLVEVLRRICRESVFAGNSLEDIVSTLPEFNSDYVFTYILGSYGVLAGAVVAAVLAALFVILFSCIFQQKNELGMNMGIGCCVLLLLNTILNILSSLGLLPPAASFLPFFSYGGCNLLLTYALLGIIMSTYRYKDIYPRHKKRAEETV